MLTAEQNNTSNRKGEKCHTPKDFDGNEAKYKIWLRMTETYFQVNSTLFLSDSLKIDFALSYMNTGRAADWAEHFTDTHMKDEVLTLPRDFSQAGYISTGNKKNPVLPQNSLKHLNPQLREKIETQKEPSEKIKDIISDARKFDKSYYKSEAWKMKLMGWQPNRPLPCQFPQDSFTPKE